jgi:hypothetical protein
MTDPLISLKDERKEMNTLEEALSTFELVKHSAGSESAKQACETSLLNWIYEGTVSDSLECAHPFIRSMMIAHNDSDETTAEQRVEAVRLGMDGALDTWWIPTEVVVSYYGGFTREETPTHHDRIVKMLTGVAEWKNNKVRPNLNGANLDGANLNGANLYGANLYGASLNGANLYGASLYGASLYGANLYGASLNGANLYGASLYGANLNGANLYGANLYGASLYGASLNGANLNGANLYGANLYGASLYGANLNGASLYGALHLGSARNLDETVGEPASLPAGWEFKNGLIVKKS